jgi:hypothetical protein
LSRGDLAGADADTDEITLPHPRVDAGPLIPLRPEAWPSPPPRRTVPRSSRAMRALAIGVATASAMLAVTLAMAMLGARSHTRSVDEPRAIRVANDLGERVRP